ncbi:Hypothetical protein POVR2_LOCUS367 [uncultured virus]|nr:Hypothetical protein POVR2_LOCUS367 [uncultured virus]
MDSALKSAGLVQKRVIIDSHLIEASTKTGTSVVVWSGEDKLGSNSHAKDSNVRLYADHFGRHAKHCSGLVIEHPDDGILACHDSSEISLNASECPGLSKNVRAIPLVTVPELQFDSALCLREADKVSSRVSNSLALNIVKTTEEYNNAYVELESASKNLFETHDEAMYKLVNTSRDLRDKFPDTTETDIDKLQYNETVLETLYSHSDELRDYVSQIRNMTKRLELLNKEILDFNL